MEKEIFRKNLPTKTRANEIEEEFGRMPDISAAVACSPFEVDGVWYYPLYGDLIGEIEGGRLGTTKFIKKGWQYDERIVKKLFELGY
jgi:hypothetical protein